MEKLVGKQRKSNIELLRILAMVLIILHHYAFGVIVELIRSKIIDRLFFSVGAKCGVKKFIRR